MKILLTGVAAAVIATGASVAYAQDNAPKAPPPPPHHWNHKMHGMHGHHRFMPHPMGTMINVDKNANGYRVRVMCSPKTTADDCAALTNKLLDRFPSATK